jgi:hypothetical protein
MAHRAATEAEDEADLGTEHDENESAAMMDNAPSPTEEHEIEALLEFLDDAEPSEQATVDEDSQEWDEVFNMLSQQDGSTERLSQPTDDNMDVDMS